MTPLRQTKVNIGRCSRVKLTSEVHNVEIAHLVPSSASDVGLMVDAGGIVGAPGGEE